MGQTLWFTPEIDGPALRQFVGMISIRRPERRGNTSGQKNRRKQRKRCGLACPMNSAFS